MIVPVPFGQDNGLLFDWAERLVTFLEGQLENITAALRNTVTTGSNAKLHSLVLTSTTNDLPTRNLISAPNPLSSAAVPKPDFVDITEAGVYKVEGVPIIGARRVGWALPTGSVSRATFDTGSVTTAQLAQVVAALIEDLYSTDGTHPTDGHGLIGPNP